MTTPVPDSGGPNRPPVAVETVSAPGGQAVGVNYGQIYGTRPGYELAPFPVAAPAPPRSVGEAPSRLLSARYRLVPFAGRHRELDDLAAWRDDSVRLAVRLVHGPGGQGKTRLAARFAALSAAAGWTVWTGRQDTALIPGSPPPELAAGQGVLVVVDYAERWPLADLFGLLADRRLSADAPVRVVLLARPAGAWWASLSHRLDDQDVAVSDLRLEPVADSAASGEVLTVAAAPSDSAMTTVRWWAMMSCISRAIRARSSATASWARWSCSCSRRSARWRSWTR